MKEPYKIVVAQPIDQDIIDSLGQIGPVYMNPGPDPIEPANLRQLCRSASGLMAFMTERIDRALLQACPDLKVVAGALKGFDNVDLQACEAHDVKFSYVPDLLTEPTAELALGLMIAAARNLISGDAHVRSGAYAGWRPTLYGGSINGATVGIVGAGAVGQALMQLLTGFRCQTQYCDVNPMPADREANLGVRHTPFEELIRTSDFVVLAVPLTPDTIGMIDQSVLTQMKRGAYLINPARGSAVVETAVADALASGQLSAYATDVYEMEDRSRADAPAVVHPSLLQSSRTVLTPHLGSAVVPVRRAIARAAADELIQALR